MGDVTSINGDRVATPNEASTDCVDMLEKWLEMAKAGKVVSVVIAGVENDGVPIHGLSEWQENPALMIGSLEFLKANLLRGGDG